MFFQTQAWVEMFDDIDQDSARAHGICLIVVFYDWYDAFKHLHINSKKLLPFCDVFNSNIVSARNHHVSFTHDL